MGTRIENITEDLGNVDAEILRAFEAAASAARFCCEAMVSNDSYQRVSGGKTKPSSKVPGPFQFGWGRRRVLELLESIPSIESQVAAQLDRARDRHDGGETDDRPRGVRGRPFGVSKTQIKTIRAMIDSGVKVSHVAHSGVIPARTFWGALKRGRDEVTGPERELYIAVYGEREEA